VFCKFIFSNKLGLILEKSFLIIGCIIIVRIKTFKNWFTWQDTAALDPGCPGPFLGLSVPTRLQERKLLDVSPFQENVFFPPKF
jgi:hypothetical protein